MAKIQIVWRRGDHVYGNDLVVVGAASTLSEAAPDFGDVPGQAEVTVLEGAVHLDVAAVVTSETGLWRAAGERVVFTLKEGQKVAAIAAVGILAGGSTDSDGNALPANFESVAANVAYSPSASAPVTKVETKVIAPYTYTRTWTYTYDGSDLTNKSPGLGWVRS